MLIKIKRKTDRKENIDGKCGRKHNKAYGKRIAIIILNGSILYLILNNNLKNNLLCLKMILISKPYKPICSKEKRESKKIINKLINLNKKEINS